MKRLSRSLVALAVVLAGCSAPKAGDKCSHGYFINDAPFCAAGDLYVCSAFTLRAGSEGVWVRTPCKGARGCGASDEAVTCDISGDEDGDPCALNFTGDNSLAACSAANPRVLLQCGSDHLLRKYLCATACQSSSDHQASCR